MRNIFIAVLLFSLLYLTPAVSADLIKTDPNASGTATSASEAVQSDDAALQQPITYEAKEKRLHTVVDELAQMTGVSIRCGDNSRDWQTRDLPVTVFVKDMPLGRLLRLLAECTHLELAAEKINDQRSYRLRATREVRKQTAEYQETKRQMEDAALAQEWGIIAAYSAQPKANITPSSDAQSTRLDAAQKLSHLMSLVGTGARDRVIAGENVLITPVEHPELEDDIIDLLKAAENSAGRIFSDSKTTSNGSADWDNVKDCGVLFYRTDEGIRLKTVVPYKNQQGSPGCTVRGGDISAYMVDTPQTYQQIRGVQRRPEPPKRDIPGDWITAWQEHKKLFKDTELDFSDRNAGLYLPMSGVLQEVARVTGYDIICEDFKSNSMVGNIPNILKKDVEVMDALTVGGNLEWLIDPEAKIILGLERDWPRTHANMVPESTLAGLQSKLEGQGVTLDDALALADLNNDQRYTWLSYSPQLKALDHLSFKPHREMWVFFASLSAEDRKLAMSDMGLPLRKVYSLVLVNAIKQGNIECDIDSQGLAQWRERQVPVSPEEIAALTMRVTKEEWNCKSEVKLQYNGSSCSYNAGNTEGDGFFKKACYKMQLTGMREGEPFVWELGSAQGFPVYSLSWKRGEGSTELQGTMVR